MRRRALTPARALWKWYWRQVRIIRRECRKAEIDSLLYGTGFCLVGPGVEDNIRRIDPCDVYI